MVWHQSYLKSVTGKSLKVNEGTDLYISAYLFRTWKNSGRIGSRWNDLGKNQVDIDLCTKI